MKRVSRGLWAGMSLLVVALSGCGFGPQVQGSGQLVQEERQVPGFVTLSVEDGIETTVVVDPNQPRKVRLVGDDNLVALMQTELQGTGLLSVHFRQQDVGSWRSNNPLRVEVTVPELQQLSHSGGGVVDVSGTVAGISGSFTLAVSGGGTAKVRGLETASFSLEVSGGGEVTAEGRSTRVRSTMSGGSLLRARELFVQEAELTSSGGGSTEMRVSDTLRVTASGGGAVRIAGQPTVLAKDLSGGSTLDFE
ncbi:DUF2807 domain-containing protein [Archangium gephyra]|uniref:head GIN domain-containing protein n=1 Tax=Archangium gephyra TaxID=48 RepID=UPI0035D51E93